MFMIKVNNERELLAVVRNPLGNWDSMQKQIIPEFLNFVNSELNYDEYGGWAFSMRFIKQSNVKYQYAVSAMDMSKAKEKEGWVFSPSIKDRNESIWIFNNTAVIIHLNSWLWFG